MKILNLQNLGGCQIRNLVLVFWFQIQIGAASFLFILAITYLTLDQLALSYKVKRLYQRNYLSIICGDTFVYGEFLP